MSLRSDIKAQSDQNIDCRSNHTWKFWRWYPAGRITVLKSVCACRAIATDQVNPDGSLAKPRTIDYSECEDYPVRGYGRIPKAEFRRERVQRIRSSIPASSNGSA